jgi:hypothetical protein
VHVDPDAEDPVQRHVVVDAHDALDHLTLDEDTATSLPAVRVVKGFDIVNSQLHPTTMCQLAAAFPQLERLHLFFCDYGTHQHNLSVEDRATFAKGLVGLRASLPRLKALQIVYRRPPVHNHNFQCRNLENEQGVDEVSEAIRLLAQDTVTDLKLSSFLISPGLFRDRRQNVNGRPTWRVLERFHIKAALMGPNGQ